MRCWFEQRCESCVELEERVRKHIHDRNERRVIDDDGARTRVGMVERAEFDHVHRRAECAILIAPAHQACGDARPATSLAISDVFCVLDLRKAWLLVDVDNAARDSYVRVAGIQARGCAVDQSLSDGRCRSAIHRPLPARALGSD